jgi:hypothetical protein
MKRQHQLVLIVATLTFSWLAMQAVHELGHVIAAIASGGRIAEVFLHPATISQTRLAENPHPLFVAWMGPIAGVVLPVTALLVVRWFKLRGWYVSQFFAGLCLIANGAYLAFGSIGHIGDAGDLIHHGAPIVLLWMFGVATIAVGLWMWNGLGPHFGLGESRGTVDTTVAYVMLAIAIATVLGELAFA